jgi:hypothetical protein
LILKKKIYDALNLRLSLKIFFSLSQVKNKTILKDLQILPIESEFLPPLLEILQEVSVGAGWPDFQF